MTKAAAVFSLSEGKLKKTEYPDISEQYIKKQTVRTFCLSSVSWVVKVTWSNRLSTAELTNMQPNGCTKRIFFKNLISMARKC